MQETVFVIMMEFCNYLMTREPVYLKSMWIEMSYVNVLAYKLQFQQLIGIV